MQKKVRAFTLSELMVVLVVSSIVVTIAFLALSTVQKQVRNIQLAYEKQQEIQYLERILLADLNTHEGYYDATKDALILMSSKDTLRYYFNKNNIVRKRDTIPLEIASKKMYLNGDEVKSGFVDAVEYYFSNTFYTSSIFAFKVKDAAYYLNN